MNTESDQTKEKPVLFFDGVCGLCNGFVDFLLKRDKDERILFSALQSEYATNTLKQDHPGLQTIVYYKDKQIFLRSRAALLAISEVGGIYKLAKIFLIIPEFFRDSVYRMIADKRYAWFGKKEACRIPKANQLKRFLD